MDLDDGVESTPGLIVDQTRIVPFLGAHNLNDKQQQNCCKPSGQNLQQRHNSALAVSIETDVWLLGESLRGKVEVIKLLRRKSENQSFHEILKALITF